MFLLAFLVSGLRAFGRRTFGRAFCDNIVFGDRGVNATARINGDTSELVEALLAEPRALEFIIIWAELFAIDAHCSRFGGNKRVSEVERLIGDKRYSGRRYRMSTISPPKMP